MRSRKNLAVGLGIALLTLLGSFSVAQAQYAPPPQGYPPPPYYAPAPPPPPRGVYRSGLVYGGSIGFGSFSFDQCGSACGSSLSGELHIGGMIAPRLALEGDFWAANHWFNDDVNGSGNTFNGIYTLALQYWIVDIIWVKAGLGLGHLQFSDDFGDVFEDETGFAFMLAAGVEIVQTYNFALDLQVRYGNATYPTGSNGGPGAGDTNMFAFMVGFNWY